MAQHSSLRALIQRLASTPVEELPRVAYFLASCISNALLGQDSTVADRAVLLHKLKTRISSLLQDRTKEGRYTGVILTKAILEAGGRDVLVDAEPWTRGLISILNKPDPLPTKRLAIITVSRVFILTQQHPSLIREITTPLLPSFITACLGVIRPQTIKTEQGIHNVLSPLLSTVLQAWAQLLRDHPATFRPFVGRFRPICLSLLSDSATPAIVAEHAGALLVALHYSAPKNGATSEWLKLYEDTIHAAHLTASQLFRSVREEWISTECSVEQVIYVTGANKDFPSTELDKIGLSGWSGIRKGSLRLSRLLSLLTISISSATAMDVSIPLGRLTDLFVRVLSISTPKNGKDSSYQFKANPEVGNEERESLWSEIPTLHVFCLRLLSTTIEVLQIAVLPLGKLIIEQLAWVFGAEGELRDIRESSYVVLRALIPISGLTMTDTEFKIVSDIVRFACRDLLPSDLSGERQASVEKGGGNISVNVDSFAGTPKNIVNASSPAFSSALEKRAADLISAILQFVPAPVIQNSLRTEIDRTSILTRHSGALLASVLNPGKPQPGHHAIPSLLPFLAHCGVDLDVEALLRPRMPVLVDKQALSSRVDLSEAENGLDLELDGTPRQFHMLDEAEESVNVHIPPATTPEVIQTMPNQTLLTNKSTAFTAQKRGFTTMNFSDHNGSNIDDSSHIPEDAIKRARIDNETTALSKELDSDQLTGDLSLERDGPNLVQQPSSEITFVGQATSNSKKEVDSIQNHSKSINLSIDPDCSDSDVPEINIEPDTDEEEESGGEMDE